LLQKKLLMIGGGHSHALALNYISKNKVAWQDVSISVISTSSRSPYSGMMTGAIADLYSVSQIFYNVSAYP
jgi:NADH dehydrogenase FAD-containing subunit